VSGAGENSTGDIASTLNGLIETCKDGEQGFQSAAEGVKDPNLQRLFQSYSQQRAEFGSELQTEVKRLSEDPVDSGHVAGALHRGWLNIKAAVSGNDEGAIISECERGEDVAVRNYREALEKGLPSNIQMIVERQFLEVKQAHDQVRSLEQAHSRSS
jgi:uncharacterized protein (TIGR02284 family)